MTAHAKFERYGAIVGEDVEVLERCLDELLDGRGILRVLEIGMHDGGTARGIEAFLASRNVRLDYVGIDVDDGTTRPRHVPAGGKVIVGDSARVFGQVPGGLDLVWVDGCHCRGHVILDTVNYLPKVRVGGFACFHDTNPKAQGLHHQPCGGPNVPEFGVSVDAAHEAIQFPWDRPPPWGKWELFADRFPADEATPDCGTRAFRRIA